MAIEDIGKVDASGGRTRKVQWDSRSGEIYVQGKPGFLSDGHMRRIGIKTMKKADAISYAQRWLDSNKDK